MKEMVSSETISHLVDRWREVDTEALLPAFGLMTRSTAVKATEIAHRAGLHEERVGQALSPGQIGRDDNGHLVDLFGVSFDPAPNRIRFAGGELFTCCALVAFMVPLLVDRAVEIESIDPLSDEPIRLEVGRADLMGVEPTTTVASWVEAHAVAVRTNVGSAVWQHVRFFASETSATEFVVDPPRRRIVSISDLQVLGRALYEAIWNRSACS